MASMDKGIELAIEACGSGAELARRIGLTRQAVSKWDKIPWDQLLKVEAATGVPRYILRPELFVIAKPESTLAAE